MKIATLQYAPKLGDIKGNLQRADEVLKHGRIFGTAGSPIGIDRLKPDILVLPELALTGYNFPSLEAIKPYTEPAGLGPSAKWARDTARRLGCIVCVGYPEVEHGDQKGAVAPEKGNAGEDGASSQQETYYNSLLVVDEHGDVILNYRKTFLYYTDETWAAEGAAEQGFHELTLRNPGNALLSSPSGTKIATSFGICMDINPYRFEAPFTAWEFANRVLDSKSQLVILSMAWLTLLSREELDALADKPDLDTFNYWVQRFLPLVRKKMNHDVSVDGDDDGKKIIIVFANRAGEEPDHEGATTTTATTGPARYAGTSVIIAITQRSRSHPLSLGDDSAPANESARSQLSNDERAPATLPYDVKILCWDMMGATSEGICFADTRAEPRMIFELVKSSKS